MGSRSYGNEFADQLAKSTASLRVPSICRIPWSDFSPVLRTCVNSLWQRHWNSLPPNFATWYRSITPSIPPRPWFHDLYLTRKAISSFSRLRFGHTLLPSHSFKLSLNDSPLCTLHTTPSICDISHILFDCPYLSSKRADLIRIFDSFNIPFNIQLILSTHNPNLILSILSFLNHSGFRI